MCHGMWHGMAMCLLNLAWHGNVSSHLVTERMWPVLYVRDVSRRPNMFARAALDRQCGLGGARGRGSTGLRGTT